MGKALPSEPGRRTFLARAPACWMPAGLAFLLLSGCLRLGPRSIQRDQFDYSTAVADALKDQTLLNIVKLRYVDLPVFVDVSQIVSGYSLETTVNAGGSVVSGSGDDGLNVGAESTFTDRPTLTYAPKTGRDFLQALMTPIDPTAIFLLLQSGYNARLIFEWSLESLNGLRNFSRAGGRMREPDPGFLRLMELVSAAQADGAVGVRVEEDEANEEAAVLFFRRHSMTPETQAVVDEARDILDIAPDRERFRIVSSPARGAPDELTVQTRSMLQVLIAMSGFVEAPAEHVRDGRTLGGTTSIPSESWPLRIHSGTHEPEDAFAAVRYADTWFWIDNRDLSSKYAFFLVTFLFALTDTGGGLGAPVLTIPAG